jgi:hypothetical protein
VSKELCTKFTLEMANKISFEIDIKILEEKTWPLGSSKDSKDKKDNDEEEKEV